MLRKEIKERLNSLYPNEYTIISRKKTYTTRDHITLKHNTCGTEYSVRIDHIMYIRNNASHINRCPNCFGSKKYTLESFKQFVSEHTNNEYSVLSRKYVNCKTKVLMKHKTCGFNYYVRPDHFISGTRCPHCIEYKNERTIRDFLENNEYEFETQKSFIGLNGKSKPLTVDFYVPEFNLIIEYDGEFHYLEKKHSNRENAFETQQLYDSLKNEYFKKNNYNLLRIPFWNRDDIDNILNDAIDVLSENKKIYVPTVNLNENIIINNYIA